MQRLGLFVALWLCSLGSVAAQSDDKLVRLYASPALVDSGIFKHILPRFSLKTQVRVSLVPDEAEADALLGPDGRALFSGLGQSWALTVASSDHPGTKRFADWLGSEIGQRAVLGFKPEGVALFSPPEAQAVVVETIEIDGDADLGRQVSAVKCGRCHTTERGRAMTGIGSTPSFFVLRAFADWEERFSAFYVLKPHGAFTQVAGLTAPFPAERPSPIAPIEMTLDEVQAILAYVAALEAADLGAPLQTK